MKYFFVILSFIGLALTLVPSILFYMDMLDPAQMKTYMLIGTLLWFSGAIPWLGRKKIQN
jgi:hypothetical protein